MSTKLPTRPAKVLAPSTPRFAIVASEYNPDFVQALVNNACKELYAIDGTCVIELFGVPGSFEIPVVAEMIAAQRRHNAIIALGVILQGRTKHAEFVGASVTDSLQQVALNFFSRSPLSGSSPQARTQRAKNSSVNMQKR